MRLLINIKSGQTKFEKADHANPVSLFVLQSTARHLSAQDRIARTLSHLRRAGRRADEKHGGSRSAWWGIFVRTQRF
jgi:hypothetical protein